MTLYLIVTKCLLGKDLTLDIVWGQLMTLPSETARRKAEWEDGLPEKKCPTPWIKVGKYICIKELMNPLASNGFCWSARDQVYGIIRRNNIPLVLVLNLSISTRVNEKMESLHTVPRLSNTSRWPKAFA